MAIKINNYGDFVFIMDYDGRYQELTLVQVDPDDEDMPYMFQHDTGKTTWIPLDGLPKEVKKDISEFLMGAQDTKGEIMSKGPRIVIILDCGEITKVTSDIPGTQVLVVNGDDSSFSEKMNVTTDVSDVDEHFDMHG